MWGAWYVAVNSPPERVTVDPVGEISVDGQFRTVVLEFTDEDGDTVTFDWFVGGQREDRVDRVYPISRQSASGELIQGSVLRIDRDEVEDGTEVQCLVSDGDPDLPPQVVRWVIVKRESA